MLCRCGCGKNIPNAKNRKYYQAFYVQGHNKGNAGNRKKNITKRTSYDYSKEHLKHINECQLEYIGSCKGVLDVCHIDQNPFNNDGDNLIKLCRSHHRLLDNGKINILNPVMPEFYMDGSGKRRYK